MSALSKCARSNASGSRPTQKHWPEASPMILAHQLASGPGPFGPNLTQSARTKSDPGWFWTICQGHLWKNAVESDNGKLVAGQLHSAGTGPSDSCTAACFQTRSVWPKADQAHAGFAQYDPGLL